MRVQECASGADTPLAQGDDSMLKGDALSAHESLPSKCGRQALSAHRPLVDAGERAVGVRVSAHPTQSECTRPEGNTSSLRNMADQSHASNSRDKGLYNGEARSARPFSNYSLRF